MEQNEREAPEKAAHLMEKYKSDFYEITMTLHPRGIEGEVRGKSSNTAWAAKKMIEESGGPLATDIFTIMDADTNFASDYFEAITYKYRRLSSTERRLVFFNAPTIFDRYEAFWINFF
jgi:hypothetical protein